MTPMARSFYAESKRVRNDRIKRELGVRLIHPDYRSGLAALLAEETAADPAQLPPSRHRRLPARILDHPPCRAPIPRSLNRCGPGPSDDIVS